MPSKTLIENQQNINRVITCLSEGKATKNCNYKQLEITGTHIEQECRHCGHVRSVMRRKRA